MGSLSMGPSIGVNLRTHGRTQREKSGPWEGELVDEEVARQSLEVFGSAWHWGISCNRQAVTKDLTSSSKFSGSCVLTLQTLPSESKVRTRPWTWIPFGFSLVSNAGHPLNRWQWKKRPALGNQRPGTQRRINKFLNQFHIYFHIFVGTPFISYLSFLIVGLPRNLSDN